MNYWWGRESHWKTVLRTREHGLNSGLRPIPAVLSVFG